MLYLLKSRGTFSLVLMQTAVMDLEKCRNELEDLLCKWRDQKEGSPGEQATALETWHKYEQLTSAHSQQLCEQLRIVLEPSIANKLRYLFHCYKVCSVEIRSGLILEITLFLFSSHKSLRRRFFLIYMTKNHQLIAMCVTDRIE